MIVAMTLSGETGKRDDDESHLLAEQGEEGLLQRSLPQVEPNSLCILIGELNLVGRCVARSPKEMVRQVAATRELDTAEVGFDSICPCRPTSVPILIRKCEL